MFVAPQLDQRELQVLNALEATVLGLHEITNQGTPSHTRLNRLAMALALQSWGALERVEVSLEQAAALLDGFAPSGINDREADLLRGVRDVLEYSALSATGELVDYGLTMLRAMHFILHRHQPDAHPGELRADTSLSAGSSLALDDSGSRLVSMLRALEDGAGPEHPPIRAGMAHLNLVAIRPFTAGNAMIARALQTHILVLGWRIDPWFVGLEEYLSANARDYFDVLQLVGSGGRGPIDELRRWIRFLLAGHMRYALIWEQRISEAERLWMALEDVVETSKVHRRAVAILYDAAMGLTVQRAHHVASAGISERVASADLRTLTDIGLLRAVGDKRGRVYVAADKLRAVRRQTRLRRPPPPDPFE